MIWSAHNLSSFYGITFDDYDSFVEYMEQDIPADIYETNYNGTVTIPVLEEQLGDPTYYDEYGNEISEEEARRRTIEDKDGNVLCEYIERNEMVCSIRCSSSADRLPITVSTYDDLEEARRTADVRNVIFGFIYAAEAAGILLVYLAKRKKQK